MFDISSQVEGYILLASFLLYLFYSYWHMENPPERDESQDDFRETDELVMTLQTGYHTCNTQTIAGEDRVESGKTIAGEGGGGG